MIEKLSISNHSLISRAEIEFKPGFTAITGETGSGKSIMMDALSLVLGERADSKVLKNSELKCVVEASFQLSNEQLKEEFERNDLDYEQHVILRREISPQGKSRAFVNDTPVNLAVLKEIGEQLVDIHAQNEQLSIRSENFRIGVLDALCGNDGLLLTYQEALICYKKSEGLLKSLQAQVVESKAEEAYIRHQTEELNAIPLDDIDEPELANRLNQAENSEEILKTIAQVVSLLDSDEGGAIQASKLAANALEKMSKADQRLQSYADRLRQNQLELADIASELERVGESTVTNPEEASKISMLLDKLYGLQQKHRVSNTDELIALRNLYREKLNKTEHSEEVLAELKSQSEKEQLICFELAGQLSKKRKASTAFLEKSIKSLLGRVGLADARFAVKMEAKEQLSENGLDKVVFMFSANPGMELQPADKVASGGEISRLMLCLKCEIAGHRMIPTLVLDEADTGTSGEVARRIGLLLAETGIKTQVVTITHLPQIAAKATQQIKVSKKSSKDSTEVTITSLNISEREEELAEMISGKNYSLTALENARELMRSH